MEPTGSSVETADVQKLRCKMNVHVTEEHQDVPFVPRVSSDVQTSSTRKLLIHRDQGVVGEVLLPSEQEGLCEQNRQVRTETEPAWTKDKPGHFLQRRLDFLQTFLSKINHGEMDLSVLLDTHLPENTCMVRNGANS